MDIDFVNWVLEFLVRQPLEDRLLNSFTSARPLPTVNPNVQKLRLLRKLDFELSQRSFSESTLELLEQLETTEFGRGNAVSYTMKLAYCAVAVDCTLKQLIPGHGVDDKERKFKFSEMVERVWRKRIGRMEMVVEKGGLGSEVLWACKDEIEAAVWDDTVCEGVMNKYQETQAQEAVQVYLKEEREKMGPSFLELVAHVVGASNGELLRMKKQNRPRRGDNVKARRRYRRWSKQEEDALITGLKKHGMGNWKLILTQNRASFHRRTEIDLKDKWRNLKRRVQRLSRASFFCR